MELSPDLTVEIPVGDLEIIRAALNSAYHHAMVIDLEEQYRKLAARPANSNLTQSLQNAVTLVMAYLDEAQALAEEEPDE